MLQLNQAQQELIGVELRDHLQSRMADLEEVGVSTEEAFSRALEEFGDAAAMARNFQYVTQLKRRRWMMRLVTFSTAGVFLMFLLAMAMWPESGRFGAPERSMAKQETEIVSKKVDNDPIGDGEGKVSGGIPTSNTHTAAKPIIDQNNEIEQILNQLVELEFEAVSWSHVRMQLQAQFKINIVTDPSASKDQLADEELIIFQMQHSLEVCLQELLLDRDATFIVKNGIVRVISLEVADDPTFLTTRIFDCQQLTQALELENSSFMKKINEPGQSGAEGIIGMVGGGMGAWDNDERFHLVPFASKQALLVHLVSQNVESAKWSQEGGPFSIEVVNGNLMVTANRQAHKDVDLLLKTMERQILKK